MSGRPFPDSCAVFPLPNCVLFPKVLLPLRIFEPRYKKMLADVLDGHGWIAVGLWQTDNEYDAEGHPDMFPILGLGRIVDYQRASDGTFKIVLLGEHRVRIRDWVQIKPYAIARIDRFSELEPSDNQRDDIRVRLRQRIKELVRTTVDSQVLMLLDETIKECEEIGPLVDSIAYHFLRDPVAKQRLLEISDAAMRERLLIETLERQRYGGGDPKLGDAEL